MEGYSSGRIDGWTESVWWEKGEEPGMQPGRAPFASAADYKLSVSLCQDDDW